MKPLMVKLLMRTNRKRNFSTKGEPAVEEVQPKPKRKSSNKGKTSSSSSSKKSAKTSKKKGKVFLVNESDLDGLRKQEAKKGQSAGKGNLNPSHISYTRHESFAFV